MRPSHFNHASKILILLNDQKVAYHEKLPILINHEKLRLRAGEMAHQAKIPTAKLDDLSSILGTHMVKDRVIPQTCLPTLDSWIHMHACTHMHK